jgi:hypothetical protein
MPSETRVIIFMISNIPLTHVLVRKRDNQFIPLQQFKRLKMKKVTTYLFNRTMKISIAKNAK